MQTRLGHSGVARLLQCGLSRGIWGCAVLEQQRGGLEVPGTDRKPKGGDGVTIRSATDNACVSRGGDQ